MRFMIIVMASSASEAGVTPTEAKLKEMGDFHAELARAGALIDGSGLQATAKGWRVHYDGAKRTVVDGPFAETKELIAGYTLIRTDTREEAVAYCEREGLAFTVIPEAPVAKVIKKSYSDNFKFGRSTNWTH